MDRQTRKLEELHNWDQNPRSIKEEDFGRLKNQIKKLGQYKPLIVTKDGTVLGGNMRLRAYRELGLTDVWVSEVDAPDDKTKLEYALSDNDRAGYYDEQALAELLTNTPDFNLDDYKVDLGPLTSLTELLSQYGPDPEEGDVPAYDESQTVSKPGEIYQLGRHRLLCGDATKKEDVLKLMNGAKAHMVFTDPPYNVDYTGKTKDALKIENDQMDTNQFLKLLQDSISNMMEVCPGNFYICMSSKELHSLKEAFEQAGGHWQSFIIWVKSIFALGRTDYQNQYEPILYGWNGKTINHYFVGYRNVGNVWYDSNKKIKYEDGKTIIRIGDMKIELEGEIKGHIYRRKVKTDVWTFDKPSKSEEHPTMKPVALVTLAINDSSREGENVLDVFCGSGTTIIAAERTNRTAYGIELDPKYCDVIRKRYAKLLDKEDIWQEITQPIQNREKTGEAGNS